jgi:signal peptidase I
MFAISIPITLSFTAVIAIELFFVTLFVIYFVSLYVSSYRPTRRLGCNGCFLFLLLMCSFILISDYFVVLVTRHIGTNYRILVSTMYPTIKSSSSPWTTDRINVNKWSYRFSDPRRGDIVFIYNDDFQRFERVVGLPGEIVDIQFPYVFINGEKLLDPPIFAKISSREDGYSGYFNAKESMKNEGIALPITLGQNEYFILGDNPYESVDSRFLGPIPRQAIVGQVIRIVFPPWRIRELTTFENVSKPLDNSPLKE